MPKIETQAADEVANTGGPELSGLVKRAGKLEAVQSRLLSALPETLRPHLKLANIRDHCLVLAVDSPVWAARIRYQSREILQTSSQICKADLREIKVKVVPDLFRDDEKAGVKRDGGEHLDRLAASLGLDRS